MCIYSLIPYLPPVRRYLLGVESWTQFLAGSPSSPTKILKESAIGSPFPIQGALVPNEGALSTRILGNDLQAQARFGLKGDMQEV